MAKLVLNEEEKGVTKAEVAVMGAEEVVMAVVAETVVGIVDLAVKAGVERELQDNVMRGNSAVKGNPVMRVKDPVLRENINSVVISAHQGNDLIISKVSIRTEETGNSATSRE